MSPYYFGNRLLPYVSGQLHVQYREGHTMPSSRLYEAVLQNTYLLTYLAVWSESHISTPL